MATVAAAGLIGHDGDMSNDDVIIFPQSILLFGCGNMGGAMLQGWIAAGLDPSHFIVLDPVACALPNGVTHIKSAAELPTLPDVVILAIKPQMLVELQDDIARCLSPNTVLISIMAGIDCTNLQSRFPKMQIARLMPNLAAAIGKSPMAIFSETMPAERRSALTVFLSPLGPPIWIQAEAQMDAVTALAGSGPAFMYRIIDALALGGAALGLAPIAASQLALAMVEGAAALAAQSDLSPTALAAKVTSPGGTTAAGLAILDADDAMRNLIENTLRAARDRAAELGKMS